MTYVVGITGSCCCASLAFAVLLTLSICLLFICQSPLVTTSLTMCLEDSMCPIVEKDALKKELLELLDVMLMFREWKKGANTSGGQEAGQSDVAGWSLSSRTSEMELLLKRLRTVIADRSSECR